MIRNVTYVAGLIVGVIALSAPTLAQTPLGTAVTYQGQLKRSGSPLNGTADAQFTLWDDPAAGNQLGSAVAVNNVSVVDGLFTVEVNAGGEFGPSAFNGDARWLQIAVRSPAGGGAFTTLSPRQELTATPYAATAANLMLPFSGSANIGGDAFAVTNTLGPAITGNSNAGYAGLSGFNTNANGYAVFGRATSTTGLTRGGWLQSASTSGIGVEGDAYATSGAAIGVKGVSDSTLGTGVAGVATAASGLAVGVSGITNCVVGFGVYGQTNNGSATGSGVYGRTDSTATGAGVTGYAGAATGGAAGVAGYTNSQFGAAVYGQANSTSGAAYGGRFQNNAPSGAGVVGLANATTGSTYGGAFYSSSPDGTGVYGAATSTSGINYGGYFESSSGAGIGVYGRVTGPDVLAYTYGGFFTSTVPGGVGAYGLGATGLKGESSDALGIGVLGNATGASSVGVYGSGPASGYGLFASGRFAATGTKSLRIDHPLDPENKYLLHYCTEGPEPLNVYTGNVITDSTGSAWVQLPDYFAEINKDLRYTLTVVDDADSNTFVQAKIAKKVQGNRFKIRTSAPHTEVTWRIEGVRNDLYVRQYGAPVEQDKTGAERGTYQHPELYRAPPEMGIHYRAPEKDEVQLPALEPLPPAPPVLEADPLADGDVN
jgi:trimeric autotransporter adhesin